MKGGADTASDYLRVPAWIGTFKRRAAAQRRRVSSAFRCGRTAHRQPRSALGRLGPARPSHPAYAALTFGSGHSVGAGRRLGQGNLEVRIAALVFDKVTVLDIVGPAELLSWVPGSEIVWVGKEIGPIRAAPTGLAMAVETTFDDISSADVLVIPGGPGVRLLLEDEDVLNWVRKIHSTTKWTTSVCTGSLLLGAAGLLKGLEATTHWNAASALEAYGATYRETRIIPQGKIVTSAGVSSGIDMALWLVGKIAGDEAAQTAQLCIEYDPQPSYDSGAPSKTTSAVIERRAILSWTSSRGRSRAPEPTTLAPSNGPVSAGTCAVGAWLGSGITCRSGTPLCVRGNMAEAPVVSFAFARSACVIARVRYQGPCGRF
jgi:putative intracellular protease/amidase